MSENSKRHLLRTLVWGLLLASFQVLPSATLHESHGITRTPVPDAGVTP